MEFISYEIHSLYVPIVSYELNLLIDSNYCCLMPFICVLFIIQFVHSLSNVNYISKLSNLSTMPLHVTNMRLGQDIQQVGPKGDGLTECLIKTTF